MTDHGAIPLSRALNRLAPVVLVVLGSLLITACDSVSKSFGRDGKSPDDALDEKAVIVVPVEVASLHRGTISSYFETTTRVEAERRVDVAAKGSARCVAVYAEEGDEVEPGKIIAELEKDEAQAAYDQTEALVRQNRTAYELASRQYDEGLGPKVEMDNARYTLEQTLATLKSLRIRLDNLTIRAPIGGIVTRRNIQPGMLVSVGTQVFSIMDPSSFMLVISPPEKELPRLKIGQKARVSIDSLQGREFDASIRRINPSVDPVSGTVKVVLDFDDDVRVRLHESAFARVKLVMSTLENVLLVPREAIVEENGRKFVFIARLNSDTAPPDSRDAVAPADAESKRDGAKLSMGEVEASVKDDVAEAVEKSDPTYTAERVEIRTGLEDNRFVQIYSGVSESDVLIVNGQHTLKSGAVVRGTNTAEAIWSKADLTADEALEEAKKRREAGDDSTLPASSRRSGGHF